MFKYGIDEQKWIKKTTDYIFILKNQWFKNNLENGGVIIDHYLDTEDLDKENLLNKLIGNPCPNHPSDHYSLAYKI